MTTALHHLQTVAQTRRSVYALNKNLPMAESEIVKIVEHAVLHTPSPFNSQSSRAVVLLGAEHEAFWQLTENALRAVVPAEKFQPTADKMAMFGAAAGTILFFEDQEPVRKLQESFPSYAAGFPVWSEHAGAMLQYAVWTSLAAVNVGANLQHYSPLVDAPVQQKWNVPQNWKMCAQMVFGGISQGAGEKTFQPVEDRLKVFGAK